MVIVVRNMSFNLLEKRKKERLVKHYDALTEIVDDNPLILDAFIEKESIKTIQKAINTLDPKYADVILLRYFYDYSNTEIASLLDLSDNTIRVRVHRAKKMLVNKFNGDSCHEETKR